MVLNITTKQNKKLFGTENENANTELQSQIKCWFDIYQYSTFIRATCSTVLLHVSSEQMLFYCTRYYKRYI